MPCTEKEPIYDMYCIRRRQLIHFIPLYIYIYIFFFFFFLGGGGVDFCFDFVFVYFFFWGGGGSGGRGKKGTLIFYIFVGFRPFLGLNVLNFNIY